MKYIKIFEDILDVNYEENSRINDYIITIFQELVDDDFIITPKIRIEDFGSNYIKVAVRKIRHSNGGEGISSLQYKKDTIFSYDEIADRVSMLIDYTKTEFENIDTKYIYYDLGDYHSGLPLNKSKTAPDNNTLLDNITIYVYLLKKKKPNLFQRFIKKFEGFDMNKSVCDRCSKPTNGITIMSQFNEDIICQDCKKLEKEDPDYELACSIERAEIRKGNTNFKGAFPNYKPLN